MDQTDSDQQEEKSAPPRVSKVTKKKGKGKNTQGIEVIDCGDGESKNPGIKGTASELPIRYTDGTVDIAEGEQGKNQWECTQVVETRVASDQISQGINEGIQLVMTQMTHMFQQVMQQWKVKHKWCKW